MRKAPVNSLQNTSRKYNQTQEQIEKLNASMAEAKLNKEKLQTELKSSEKEINEVRKTLSNLQKERRVVERDLNKQIREKKKIESAMARERALIAKIDQQKIEQLQLKETPDWLSGTDPHQKARTEALLELLRKRSEESYKKLHEQQIELAKIVHESRVSGEKLRNNVKEERSQQQRLNNERRNRQRMVVRLEKDLAVKATSLKKLRQDEQRLSSLMARLEKQAKARTVKQTKVASKSKEKRVAEKSSTAPVTVSTSGIPVVGKVVARFGQKRQDGKNMGNWKGVVFSVNEEEPVKAIRGGKVVFSDYLRGYGNLLIIDHGKGYFSVYGNNSSMEKDIGDLVKQGEVISHVGSKESDLSVLYFELRHNGKPINPNRWLKL